MDGTFFIRTWGADHPATPAFMLAYRDGADATLSRLWFEYHRHVATRSVVGRRALLGEGRWGSQSG